MAGRALIVSLPTDGLEREAAIVALIVSKNIGRRHMTVSQRAMALAMHYPTPATLKRKGTGGSSVAQHQGVSAERLSRARYVLRWSEGAADAVMAGTKTLDAAYAPQVS